MPTEKDTAQLRCSATFKLQMIKEVEEAMLIKALQANNLFAHLTTTQARELTKMMEAMEPAEGTIVYKQGEDPDGFYVVESGVYHEKKSLPGEEEQLILVAMP